ncbi:MAG: transposase zinc-binding domain-containing protein [Spirochaetota bacterium]
MVSSLAVAPVPLSAPATPVYQPHGRSDLQRLFRERFPTFETCYEERYADDFGKFRLPLTSASAKAFDVCGVSPVGDWENGIARIRCSDCGYDYFRPFSCKSFFLCPSCGQDQLR